MQTKRQSTMKQLMLWVTLTLSSLFLLNSESAQATHFRYGHLTWQKVSGNTVRFTLVDAFRRSGYGAPNVGDIILETVGSTSLIFGDGNFTGTLKYRVIAVDAADDWIIGRALDPTDTSKTTIDHTYASADNAGAPWLAEVNTNARTSTEINNPNGDYRLLTYVETNSGNRSPSSSLPAIVNVKQGPASTFIVPGADPDANTLLKFRLATGAEAAGNGVFNQPVGLTIDSVSGLVTWNTTTAVLGGLYSCQVIIEDRNSLTGAFKTQVPVDFLIEIFTCNPNNNAPAFVSPTPVCASIINATENQPVSFTIKASDPDAIDMVSLNTGGLPTGATVTPGLPITGNPVTTVFNWTPAIGSAGDHVIIFSATDDCGQQTLCSFTIHVTSCGTVCNLGLTISKTSTVCAGSCDGTLTANPSKGLAPYHYIWSNGQTTKTATGLCKATYTVTVTDSKGCSKTASCTVISPSAVKIVATQTNVKCKGSCTGSILVTASGGSGTGYHYNWSNGATTANIYTLCKGTFTLTVTDSKGCTATSTKIITEPAKVLAVTLTKTTCSVCQPNCNGTATANPTGGTTPYTYLWSSGATTKQITSLCAGTYTVTVTDKNGCIASCQTTIVGSCCNISFHPTITNNTNCTPCNGSISVSPTGGSGSYHYSWSTGGTSSSISGLCAGGYTVTVYDNINASCTATASYQVMNNISLLAEPEFNITSTCPGFCTGSIELSGLDDSATGYAWSNGATTAIVDELCEGPYTVTVTYNNGCTHSYYYTVLDKDSADVFPSYLACHDSCNGAGIVLNDVDYASFLWSSGQTTADASNLCAGIYTVTVTDYVGCVTYGTLELTNPDIIVAICSVVTNESAPGTFDGELHGDATGGLNPLNFTFLWSNSQINQNATGLGAGNYTLTVTDDYGCQATTTCSIIDPNSNCTGDFTTYSQGGWGNPGTPGQYMASHFESCFDSIIIGDPCGFTIKLTTVSAVQDFLPQGTAPAALTQNYVDPGSANITVLAGQVLSVAFALGFDDCDPNLSSSPSDLGNQIYVKLNSPFYGWNIQAIYDTANRVLAGCSSQYTPAQVNIACTDINENYDNGDNNNLFVCPDDFQARHSGNGDLIKEQASSSIYPNPFSENFVVKFSGDEVFKITITDYCGRLVRSYSELYKQTNLGDDLAPGIYMIQLESVNGYKSSNRIIKMK